MLVEFECPKCKGHVCERWSLSGSTLGIRLMYWHLFLNPGIAINELIFGQRIPKETYICKSCTVPLGDRSYVHCTHCGIFHPGRIWSYKNAFGHWLGIVCPTCGGEIACCWNLTSRVLAALTAPLWYLPVKRYKTKWLQQQHKRITQANEALLLETEASQKPVDYKLVGLLFGGLMFVFLTLFYPLMTLISKGNLTLTNYITLLLFVAQYALIACPLAGLFFGLSMKYMMDKKGDQSLHLTYDAEGKVVSLPGNADNQ